MPPKRSNAFSGAKFLCHIIYKMQWCLFSKLDNICNFAENLISPKLGKK